MPYDSIVSRTDADALIPEEVSNELLTSLSGQSAVLGQFRRIPVATNQVRFPVLSALPTAYFVTGDTGLKQTTEMAWTNKFLDVEELACIVPMPESVLDDASFDIWGEIRPGLEEAVARALDNAVFFGVNAPASWPDDVVTAATAAGNTEARGTAAGAAGGIAEDMNQAIGEMEADGFMPSGAVANPLFKKFVRGLRDTTGQSLGDISMSDFWGIPVSYPMPGLWPTGSGAAEVIFGDFARNFVVGVRKDFTYTVATEGVIQDNTGAIVYNLFQQDMVALRVVFRAGWQVANIINRQQPTEGSRYPASILTAP